MMENLNLKHCWRLIPLAVMIYQAGAATYTLPPGADARIIDYGGLRHANYEEDILSVYNDGGNVQRTLLQFDLSGIALAGNEQIASAVLTLTASTAWGINHEKPMEVYRVFAPWSEQTATWMERTTGAPWITPGGDFVGSGSQPYAVSTNSPANNHPISWDVTWLVDEWMEELTPNYGMLLKSDPGNRLTFVQSESAVTNLRPVLTVTTALGPPRLTIATATATGQTVLSWRGIGFAILQERVGADGGVWTDSALPVTAEGERSVVKLQAPGGARYFRLRLK